MEEESFQYYTIVSDADEFSPDAAEKLYVKDQNAENVMLLTFNNAKSNDLAMPVDLDLENEDSDPSSSNVEYINIKVENGDIFFAENEEATINENKEDYNYLDEEEDASKSVGESENDNNTTEEQYKKIFLEDGTCAIIEQKLWDSLLENSKVQITDKKEKKYPCTFPACDKIYTAQHHLTVHVRNHTGTRPYKCDICDKSFVTGYSLKAHARTHTGEKPYGCSVCEKHFKTSGDLQKHIRIHTGEKPFRCPVEGCGRAFTTSNIRKVHIRSHTGERPYACKYPDCGKAFASTTNYKNHMRIHSGEKPYVCPVTGCNKRFTEYSSLYKHSSVHMPYKPYVCNYCNLQCKHEATLKSHKRAMHNIVITEDGTEIMITRE